MPIHKEPIAKNVPPINFLFFRTRTSLKEISTLVGHVQEELYADAVDHKLFISGPAYWNYFDFQGVDLPFDLEISLPIANRPAHYRGKYNIKTSGAFRCISLLHEGSWEKFPEAYQFLMANIQQQKLGLTGESRELYLNIDFENPEANITEIQIGIV
jgi:effector-binding domain-containing protein